MKTFKVFLTKQGLERIAAGEIPNYLQRKLVAGARPAREKKYRKREFDNLVTTPFLNGSEYLNELYQAAEKKEEYECILQHMYNHQNVGVLEIESYQSIEQKIIERYR